MPGHHVHTHSHAKRAALDEIQAFLNRFSAGLTAGDGKAVAQLWDVPSFIISDDKVMTVDTLAQVEQFFGAAKDLYNVRGIVDTKPEILERESIGDKLAVVKVRWPYLDKAGKVLGSERSDYTLRRDDLGQWKIRAVLMRGVSRGLH